MSPFLVMEIVGLTRFSGHSRLVVSSCSNHEVVVESLKAGGADHSEAGVPAGRVVPSLGLMQVKVPPKPASDPVD
jgi:hypothetical protein